MFWHMAGLSAVSPAHGSFELDDEDVYFDDESAEVVISSLRLGNDQESGSIFTNSDWFAFEDEKIDNDYSTGSIASASPNIDGHEVVNVRAGNDVVVEEDKDVSAEPPETKPTLHESDQKETKSIGFNRLHEWVECRESSNSVDSL